VVRRRNFALPAVALGLIAAAIGCAPSEPAPLRPRPAAGPVPAMRPPGGVGEPTLVLIEAARDLDGAVVGPADPRARATVAIVFASWCGHCRDEVPVLAALRARHPDVRILGVNYVAHETYAGRGGPVEVRAFVDELAPWLRVVPADDRVWASLGRPRLVPSLYVFDGGGALVHAFDGSVEGPPSLERLEQVLP
jgi:thiol-disulfide isomerase/thioredoxin